MNADGTQQTNISRNRADDYAPAWSPRLADQVDLAVIMLPGAAVLGASEQRFARVFARSSSAPPTSRRSPAKASPATSS